MDKVLALGGLVRPTHRPFIAVSMQVADEQALEMYLATDTYQQADILEWRIDAWNDLNALTDALISQTITKSVRPIILTWRTLAEGGLKSVDKEEYLRIYQSAIKHGVAAVDIEVSLLDQVISLLTLATEHDVVVIGSRHDWDYPTDVIDRLLDMLQYPIDVIKYVAMAETEEQAMAVLHALDIVLLKSDQPFIVMAMGDAGSFTRLAAFEHGSQLTFAQTGISSAPGQLLIEDVQAYFHNKKATN